MVTASLDGTIAICGGTQGPRTASGGNVLQRLQASIRLSEGFLARRGRRGYPHALTGFLVATSLYDKQFAPHSQGTRDDS